METYLSGSRGEPSLLVVDDDPAVGALVETHALRSGFQTVVKSDSARGGLDLMDSRPFRLVLLDLGLPDRPGISPLPEFLDVSRGTPIAVVTADNRLETAVRCMKEGAFDFLDKPISQARLLSLFSHAAEHARLGALLRPPDPAALSPAFSRIVTASPLMYSLFHAIERVAPSPLPVLVSGESGTGKELISKAIHDLSGRTGAFVPVNVAGLDGALFSDVLFGHSRGAYTGAESVRQGLVKRAEGGTLFLDEIGDLGTETQVKLLRFLQDGEYYPLGTDRPERADCRVVLATHVDLYEAVRSGRFRADLYYRLMVHYVAVPPLRDRREDIPILADFFARQAAAGLKLAAPVLDPGFLSALSEYPFPGNVRELSAVVYGAVADSADGRPSGAFIRSYVARHRTEARAGDPAECPDYPYETDGRFPTLDELELQHIREALRRAGGNQTAAAVLLGISQSTISRRLRDLRGK